LTVHPSSSKYLEYKLVGTMNINSDNINTDNFYYEDKAKYFKNKEKVSPILSNPKE
jgi:hypothetical protein